MEADSVILEIAVAQLDQTQSEEFESFWQWLDQQKFDLEVRKMADQNGLRFGAISSNVPATLQRLLEPFELEAEKMNPWEAQLHEKGLLPTVDRLVVHQRIQNRDGQTHIVPTSRVHDEASWVVEEGSSKTPGAGRSVLGGFQIKSYQNSNGSVRLVLTPQLQHGQTKPRIGLSERSFMIESGQATHRIESLQTDIELLPGETVIVAPTVDNTQLGALLMAPAAKTNPAEKDGLFRVLMIRLVQTQADDLFQTKEKIERLSSVPDF